MSFDPSSSTNNHQQEPHPEHFYLDKKVNLVLIITIVMNLLWGGYIFGVNKTILDTHTDTIKQIITSQKKLTDSTIKLNSDVQANSIYIDSTSKNLAEVSRTLRQVNENQIRLQSKLEK